MRQGLDARCEQPEVAHVVPVAVRTAPSKTTCDHCGRTYALSYEKAVAEGERRQLKAADVEKDCILQELKAIAFVRPMRSMLDDDGRILPPSEWPEDVHAAVKSYDVVTKNVTAGDGHQDKVIRASFWNKIGCLELLGKHFGVAQEDTETKMHEEIALALDQGRERCYRLGLMSRETPES